MHDCMDAGVRATQDAKAEEQLPRRDLLFYPSLIKGRRGGVCFIIPPFLKGGEEGFAFLSLPF